MIPMVPRYSQLLLPGGATATCDDPGYAWGMVAPGEANTSPPVACSTLRVPCPVRAAG